MATYTASTYDTSIPKQNATGVQYAIFSHNFTAASSVSDRVFLAKIPHGARVLEGYMYHTTGATAQGLSLGLATGGPAGSETVAAYISAGAQATSNRVAPLDVAPFRVSCSDADPNRFGILQATVVSGTATTSLKISGWVMYAND